MNKKLNTNIGAIDCDLPTGAPDPVEWLEDIDGVIDLTAADVDRRDLFGGSEEEWRVEIRAGSGWYLIIRNDASGELSASVEYED